MLVLSVDLFEVTSGFVDVVEVLFDNTVELSVESAFTKVITPENRSKTTTASKKNRC